MKVKLGLIAAALLLIPLVVNAQAPNTVAGDGVLIEITSGTYPLASYGYSVFLTANSGNSYQLIGIYGVSDNSGTYSYASTGSGTGQIMINDTTDNIDSQTILSFSSANQGTFGDTTISPPGYSQSGYFVSAVGSAPGSIAGMSVYCAVNDGLFPLANSGYFTIVFSATGNTYIVTGDWGVANSSGTYSYSLVNRSTGAVKINDSVSGTSTLYVGFSTPTSGGYAAKQTTGGFQIGSFSVLDTTPPTVSITSPTAGEQWSNSVFAVTGTAADNIQVASVYCQVNGQGWNLATSTNNWANWSGNVALLPGTNAIQAYSVDTSDNTSPVDTQDLFYVLPAPVSVQINGSGKISPNYNGQSLDIGKSYSMNATPSAGVIFTGWSGTMVTSNATLNFTMASNLTFTANFLDITKPALTITTPTNNQSGSNSVYIAKGTASDNVQVSNVWFQLNGGGWNLATSSNGWTNWSANLNLQASNNTLQAYAVDTTGNLSTTSSVKFVYIATGKLLVKTTGHGTLSPNYSNAVLQIGKGYSMTAAASAGFTFTHWIISTNWGEGVVSNNAVLNFVMRSNLTLQANFEDTTKPTLSITNLVAGQRVSNVLFTVKGTANDNVRVAAVWLRMNGGVWTNAVTANIWTNWSAALDLIPGTNTVAAYAVDTSGNFSTTNTFSFDFVVTNQLHIRVSGLGTFSTNYNNAWLEIGRNYSITSTPASGFVFTNWTISTNWIGGAVVTGTNLHFIMASNLTLQASFVETSKPTLTITAPSSGQHMTNALATVTGTTSDKWGVVGVWYQLNNGAWNTSATTNGWTNWTTKVQLISGTNTVKVFAMNLGENLSTTNSASMVSSNTFKLQLAFMDAPMTSKGLAFNLQVSTGLNGLIQFSTNMTTWSTLTNFVGTNSTIMFHDSAATNLPRRFYRAVIP